MLDDGTAGREVAAQHGHAASRLHGAGGCADDGLVGDVLGRVGDLADGAAVDRRSAAVEMIAELFHQLGHTAGPVEMLHVVVAGGLEIDQHRHLAADRVEFLEIDREAGAARDRGQMDQPVGGAADCLQNGQRIAEGGLGQEFARLRPALSQPNRLAPARLGGANAVGMGGGDRARARQRDAERLDEAAHRRGCAHHHAGALRRREPAAQHLDLGLVDLAGAMLAPEPAAIGAGAEDLALVVADKHRPGDQLDRWHIGADRTHELGWHRLVAAADQHDGVAGLRPDHLLGVDRHQVAQEHRGRVGEGFVDGDRRKLHRQAAGQHHAALHRLDQAGHVAMAGVEVAEGVGDADDRPVERIVGEAGGLDEGLAQEQREAGIAIGREIAAHAACGLHGWGIVGRAHAATNMVVARIVNNYVKGL